MLYPLKVVSLDYRNHSERVFQKEGKIDLSSHNWTHPVTHLVHIGTHRGLSRVLTDRVHREY